MDTLIYFFAVLGVVFFIVLIILAAMYVAGEVKISLYYRRHHRSNITKLLEQINELQCCIDDMTKQ